MDKTVARLNIEHFRRKLAEETDPSKHETLRQLLAQEEAKLKALGGEAEEEKKQG